MPDSPRILFTLSLMLDLGSAACFAWMGASHHSLPFNIILAIVSMTALMGAFFVIAELKDGISNERWPMEVVDPLKRIVTHWSWKVLMGVGIVVMIASCITSKGFRLRGYWPAFIVTQVLIQLPGAFRTPLPAKGNRLSIAPEAGEFASLQSDHWGAPRL